MVLPMNKWEYFFYSIKNNELNNPQNLENSPLKVMVLKGEEGWELVSMAVYPMTTLFAFKRRKETK